MTEEQLPKWAQDRLRAEENMGELRSTATFWEMVLIPLWFGWRLFLFLLFCAIVYLVGKAILG